MSAKPNFPALDLNSISPFYFVFGPHLVIEDAGSSLAKIDSRFNEGEQLEKLLTLTRPKGATTYESLKKCRGELCVFDFHGIQLQLRGQLLDFDVAADKILFLGAPSVLTLEALAGLGLVFKDFAVHDPLVDYLFLLQSLKIALADAKKFSDELALRSLEEKKGLAKLPEQNPQPLLRVETDTVVIYANPVSRRAWNAVVGEKLPVDGVADLISRANKTRSQIEVELEHRGRIYSLIAVPIEDATYLNIYGRDITEKKKAESELEQSRVLTIASAKMASLGEMASGIAHEINSPLATINVFSGQLKEMVDEGNIDKSYLGIIAAEIESTSLRIAKIVAGLRSFSRESTHDPFSAIPIQSIIDDTLALCSERYKQRGVTLVVDTHSAQVEIDCRPSEISQVILNLLNNAHDAVEHLPEKWVKLSTKENGNKIDISVTDSGSGISPKIEKKLFQPFFTTKEVGKGTGLGLSISKQIIESHGGSLKIEHACSNTSFIITLPRKQTQAASHRSMKKAI